MKTKWSGLHTSVLQYKVQGKNKNKIAGEFSNLKTHLKDP